MGFNTELYELPALHDTSVESPAHCSVISECIIHWTTESESFNITYQGFASIS